MTCVDGLASPIQPYPFFVKLLNLILIQKISLYTTKIHKVEFKAHFLLLTSLAGLRCVILVLICWAVFQNAPHIAPFLMLGDVMPHLRAKARPPPGFSTTKSTDMLMPETPPTGKFVSSSSTHSGSAGVGIFNSGPSRNGGAVEAQNRFLESLMSNGMQGPSAAMTGGMYTGRSPIRLVHSIYFLVISATCHAYFLG